MITAEIILPYFEQGDDLAWHLADTNGDVGEALEQHACHMEDAADALRELKAATDGADVTIEAESHFISVTAEDEVINRLRAAGLLLEPLYEREFEE